jgi:rRNA processing protein Gar1
MSSEPSTELPSVGTVVRPAPGGDLLVQSNGEPVEPGTRCRTESGAVAATVEDVIGPVDDPFLVVSPSEGARDDERDELVGAQLYPR